MKELPETRPHVRAAMTPFPRSIEIDTSLEGADEIMSKHRIRHLPVTDRGELVGILSQRDLQTLKASVGGSDELDRITITSAVTRKPYVVDSLEPLDRVAAEMARRHIGSALVVHEGKLAGIFTSTDACRYLSEVLLCMYRKDNEIA